MYIRTDGTDTNHSSGNHWLILINYSIYLVQHLNATIKKKQARCNCLIIISVLIVCAFLVWMGVSVCLSSAHFCLFFNRYVSSWPIIIFSIFGFRNWYHKTRWKYECARKASFFSFSSRLICICGHSIYLSNIIQLMETTHNFRNEFVFGWTLIKHKLFGSRDAG